MRNSIKRAVIGAALAMVSLSAAQAETLGEALTGAYMSSGLIEQNRAVLRAADEDVAQAVAALRPVVSWTTTASRRYGTNGSFNAFGALVESDARNQTFSIEIAAQATLYAGGANLLGIEAAKQSVLATRSSLIGVEQDVLLQGVSAFMEMRRAIENVALRENNVRVIGEELRAARDRFEVGEVTRTDVALAEARLASAQSDLAAAQGSLAIATEAYIAAVGRAPVNPVAPTSLPSLPAGEAGAKAIALRNHPDIISAQHQVAAADLSVRIAEAALGPNVTLRGTYGRTENFDDDSFTRGGTVSLTTSIPLYQGGQLASLVRDARASRDQSRAGLHLTRIAVEQSVGNAYAQLRVAQATTEAVRAEVAAATVAFRGVREEATLGARTTLDVLDAEQELLDARARQVSAQVDETIAAYAVLASIGQLTASDLRLPVPDYDPAAYYNMVKDAPAAISKQGLELDRVLRALGKE